MAGPRVDLVAYKPVSLLRKSCTKEHGRKRQNHARGSTTANDHASTYCDARTRADPGTHRNDHFPSFGYFLRDRLQSFGRSSWLILSF